MNGGGEGGGHSESLIVPDSVQFQPGIDTKIILFVFVSDSALQTHLEASSVCSEKHNTIGAASKVTK